MLTLRVTEDEKALLDSLRVSLGLRGRVDVIRASLDYFLAHSPTAKTAMKSVRK